jgi:hypothetical protein
MGAFTLVVQEPFTRPIESVIPNHVVPLSVDRSNLTVLAQVPDRVIQMNLPNSGENELDNTLVVDDTLSDIDGLVD